MRSSIEQVARYLADEAGRVAHGRVIARWFDASEPGWPVYHSSASRALVAMPMWNIGEAVVLTDPAPRALWFQMRRVETARRPLAPQAASGEPPGAERTA